MVDRLVWLVGWLIDAYKPLHCPPSRGVFRQALKISSDAVQVCNLSNEEADFNAVRTVSFAMRNYTNVQQTFYFGNDLEPGFFKFGIQTCATSPMTVEPECKLACLDSAHCGGSALSGL